MIERGAGCKKRKERFPNGAIREVPVLRIYFAGLFSGKYLTIQMS